MAGNKIKRISFTVVNDLSYDQRMQRICGTLAKAGFSVTLIGRKLPQSKALPDFPFTCVRLPYLFRSGKAFYVELQIRLFIYLFTHRFDMYSAVDLDTLLPNLMVARLKGKKAVYDAHEYFTEVPEVVRRRTVQKIWTGIEKFCVPRVDLAYTVSQGLADLFEEKYHKPFSVIRNLPFRQPSIKMEKHDPPFILYQGALNEGRCLEMLLPAIQGLPLHLWIAGEGDLSSSLRQLCRDLKMEGQVKFLGYVSPMELREITPQAYLGFNVLENKGLSYYYSLANKCFDYLQAGVPCLCSPFPEYIRLAQEYPALIFAAAHSEEIRLAITRLLNNPEIYQQLVAACIPAGENLNWESEEPLLLALYEKQV
ncbi:MAG: glycosyltransferase [Bacteroidia bacterium]